MRSLSASRSGSSWWLLIAVVVLGGWIGWVFEAHISLYETSDDARLEVEHAAHSVEASVAGRVIANHLVLGERVQAGQVIVELDADTERLQLAEEQTQPNTLTAQLSSLRNEIDSEGQALDEARQTARTAIDEAHAQHREAEAAAQYARTEAERLASLYEGGFISELDFLHAKSKAQEEEAVADRMRLSIVRLEQEHRTVEYDRQTRIEQLNGELQRIEGQMFTGKATIKRIEHEITKRQIQAPISGRVGEIADLRAGAFISEGTKLGAIIPDGGLRAVAYFPPEAALGRVQPGQPARIRLNGFPWSQFGSLPATVATVASEQQDGRVRVELEVHPDSASLIPLQHGLPGIVEIEIKKVSPLALIMQYVERTLTASQSAAR